KSSSSSSSSSGQSKTISRLASKSESTAKAGESRSTTAKSDEETPKDSGSNTLARLSRSASQDNAESKPSPTSLPRPEVPAEPAAAAPAEPAESSPEPVFDTSFLAQPVRKGADSGSGSSDDSKGPQSNHIPKRRGLGNDIRP